MSRSKVSVEHVRLTAVKPFDEFTAAFEGRLGHFDEAVSKEPEHGLDPAAVKARLESMVGPSGFMLFRTSDQGGCCGSSACRGKRSSISSATPYSRSR